MSGLRNITSKVALNAYAPDVPVENLAFFSHGAALRALHEYFGYLPDGDLSSAMDDGHVAEYILTLGK